MSRLAHAAPVSGSFFFDGHRVGFHEGDSIAAALHGAGILTLARSRKFHMPRGLSGCFVAGHQASVDGMPHARLDRLAAREGLVVARENVWPGGGFDLLRLARLLPRRRLRAGFEHSRLIPSGTPLFEPWERLLRFMAGESEVPPVSRRGILAGRRIETDVVVVGGGPAGHAAASEAATAGQRVVLVTRGAQPGASATAWGVSLPQLPAGVTVLAAHEACGLYDAGLHLVCAPRDPGQGATVVAAERVVLATGRRSVPPLVAGAELPGVMDAATALALAHDHGVAPGARVAVIGSGAEERLAARLRELGITVVATLPATRVSRILGRSAVTGVEAGRRIACDCVVHAGPWRSDPRLHFMASAEGDLRLLRRETPQAITLAGSAAEPAEPLCHGGRLDRRALVCPCMDVTVDEILDLAAAGEHHVEVLKRLTGCGMGPCQGVPCWDQLGHVLATATGRPAEDFGHPSYRPPGAALTLAQAAGLADLVPLS